MRHEVGVVLGKHVDAQMAEGLGRNEVMGRIPGDQSALRTKQEPREDLADDDRER